MAVSVPLLVRITVKKRDQEGGKVSFTLLSEGELQMFTVLELMRITNEDHCLFLLDEPDTHLNPIWKLRYFDDIESVLTSRSDTSVQGESQILITTHDDDWKLEARTGSRLAKRAQQSRGRNNIAYSVQRRQFPNEAC